MAQLKRPKRERERRERERRERERRERERREEKYMREDGLHRKAARALHVHEERVRRGNQAFQFVLLLLVLLGGVEQVSLDQRLRRNTRREQHQQTTGQSRTTCKRTPQDAPETMELSPTVNKESSSEQATNKKQQTANNKKQIENTRKTRELTVKCNV